MMRFVMDMRELLLSNDEVRYGYERATTILESMNVLYAARKVVESVIVIYALTNFSFMSERDMSYIIVH